MHIVPTSDAEATIEEVEVPPPPAVHWTLVLLLSICTGGLFAEVWLIVQAIWVAKYDRSNRALHLLIAPIPITLVGAMLTVGTQAQGLLALAVIGAIITQVVGIFGMKSS